MLCPLVERKPGKTWSLPGVQPGAVWPLTPLDGWSSFWDGCSFWEGWSFWDGWSALHLDSIIPHQLPFSKPHFPLPSVRIGSQPEQQL